MDSQVVVKTLLEVDPQFSALCDTLFGPAVDPADVWAWMYTREGVSKMNPAPSDVATKGGALLRRGRGALKPLAYSATGGVAANQLPQSGKRTFRDKKKVTKADSAEVTWDVEFSKVDEDKRQVFGWASIVSMGGEPVVDRQGDWIAPEEIEKAAYKYVVESRKGGHQHRRTEDDQPFHASDMIESIVFTPEKIAKMGLPEDFPSGWWVGYQVRDEDTWQKVKKGDVTGFSIHGRGRRAEVAA